MIFNRYLQRVLLAALATFVFAATTARRGRRFSEQAAEAHHSVRNGRRRHVPTEHIMKEMEAELGQPIVRDYRGGAGGTIAMEMAAAAPADGYTMFIVSTSQAISAGVYDTLKTNVVKDFAPVTLLASTPYVLVINPEIPAQNVQQLIAYGKSNPGKLILGTSGAGNSDHIIGQEFARLAGIELVHVPYRGAGPAIPDLLTGRVNVTFFSPLPTKQHVESGKLRLLGVTTKQRSPAMPNVPSIAEQGLPDYDFPGWYGLAVPAGTPPDVVARYCSVRRRGAAQAIGRQGFPRLQRAFTGRGPVCRVRVVPEQRDQRAGRRSPGRWVSNQIDAATPSRTAPASSALAKPTIVVGARFRIAANSSSPARPSRLPRRTPAFPSLHWTGLRPMPSCASTRQRCNLLSACRGCDSHPPCGADAAVVAAERSRMPPWRSRVRSRRSRRRLSQPRTGPEPPVRPFRSESRAGQHGSALWTFLGAANARAGASAVCARLWAGAVRHGRGRAGMSRQCVAKSAGLDSWQAAHPRAMPSGAPHRRSVAPLRLLPGKRWRLRRDRH